MDTQTPLVYTTDNSNDRNYIIANKERFNLINISYLTSGIFFNKTIQAGLQKKNEENEKNRKNEKKVEK